MNKLQIQTPNSDNIIPIYGAKKAHRLTIENSSSVKKCVGSDLLLTEKFYHLLTQTLSEHKKIQEKWELLKTSDKSVPPANKIKKSIIDELKSRNYVEISEKNKEEGEKLFDDVFTSVTEKIKIDERQQITREIDSLSKDLEIFLVNFESTEKLPPGQMEILSSTRFFTCGECFRILNEGSFRPVKCICGKKVTKHQDCDERNLLKLNKATVDFIEQNMWLEYGVENILEKMGYSCISGADILGNSGITHEIDVVAKKEDTTILVECKAQELIIRHILIFYGKMADIGVSWGYIFTIDDSVSADVRKLAKSKNIIIIDNILLKAVTDIKSKIAYLEGVLSK